MKVNDQQAIPTQDAMPYGDTGYWISRRHEIHAWLHEQSPSLAELYQGAVCLMFGQAVSGRVRFVSHAVREIRNRLPGEVSNRLDYTGELDRLAKSWETYKLPLTDTSLINKSKSETSLPSPFPDISIPQQLFLEIQLLLLNHTSSRTTGRERARRLFEQFVPESQINSGVLGISVDRWWQTTSWFMSRAHDNGQVDTECDENELNSRFAEFESFLGTLSQSFYGNTNELDEILEETNA